MIAKTQTMESQSRIEELLAEALKKYDKMVDQQEETNRRLATVESKILKLNLQTTENSWASLKLADKLEVVSNMKNEFLTRK